MTKLFKKIKSFIPQSLENSTVKEDEYAHFTISYKDLDIGFLELEGGKWHFSYSGEFKNQDQLPPLPDFPDADKTYTKIGRASCREREKISHGATPIKRKKRYI